MCSSSIWVVCIARKVWKNDNCLFSVNDGPYYYMHALHLSLQKMEKSMYVVGTRTDSWVSLLRRWILQHFLWFPVYRIKSSSYPVAGTTPWHCLRLVVCLCGAQIHLVSLANLECRSKVVVHCSCLLRYLILQVATLPYKNCHVGLQCSNNNNINFCLSLFHRNFLTSRCVIFLLDCDTLWLLQVFKKHRCCISGGHMKILSFLCPLLKRLVIGWFYLSTSRTDHRSFELTIVNMLSLREAVRKDLVRKTVFTLL